jgi:gas vesicle protein
MPKNKAITHEEAKKLKEKSLKRIIDLNQFVNSINLSQDFIRLFPEEDQKAAYDTFGALTKAINTLKQDDSTLQRHEKVVATVDVTILEKQSNYVRPQKIGGRTFSIFGRSEAGKIDITLGHDPLKRILNPLSSALRELGKMIGDEIIILNDLIAGDKTLIGSIPGDIEKRKVELEKYYNQIGDYFVKLTGFTDDGYEKNLARAEKIHYLFNQLNNNLDQLKLSAKIRGGMGVAYDELKNASARLFLKPVFKEDLQEAEDHYCKTLRLLRPKDALREKMEAFKKSIKNEETEASLIQDTNTILVQDTSPTLIKNVKAILSEIQDLQIQFKKELNSLSPDDKLQQYYNEGMKKLELLNNHMGQYSAQLEAGKPIEWTKEMDALFSTASPNDHLIKKTEKNIHLLSQEMSHLRDSMNQYIRNFGIELGVPLIEKIVSILVPFLTPISSEATHQIDKSMHFISSKIDKLQETSIDSVLTHAVGKFSPEIKSEEKEIKVVPGPGWDKTLVDDLKDYSQSQILPLAKVGAVFTLCTLFPPVAPLIAGLVISAEMGVLLYRGIKKEFKYSDALDDTISIIKHLKVLALVDYNYDKLASNQQHALFKLVSLLGKNNLDIQLPLNREHQAKESDKNSTTKIAAMLNINDLSPIEDKSLSVESKIEVDHPTTAEKENKIDQHEDAVDEKIILRKSP